MPMRSLTGFVSAVFVASVCCTGCSVIKDSKDMKKTLNKLNGKGDHIAKRADDLEREMKFKESTAMFAFAMEMLFGENGKNGGASESWNKNPETEMVLFAEMGIRSLMFQFWKGDYYEATPESLDRDFDLAVSMLFTRINKYIPRDMKLDMLMPDRAFKGIASLAARMEQVQPIYVESLRKRGLPDNLSLYEVIALALNDRRLPEQTGLLPKTKAKILQWQPEAMYLMQLRHNYLPMLVLSRMTDFQDRGDMSRAIMAIRGQKIDLLDENKVSFEQLREWTYWLNQAASTRARLQQLGIKPVYNPVLGTMLRAPDFADVTQSATVTAAGGVQVSAARIRAVSEFSKAYEAVVKDMPNLLSKPKVSVTMPEFKMPDFAKGWFKRAVPSAEEAAPAQTPVDPELPF